MSIVFRHCRTVPKERWHLYANLVDDNYNLINKNTNVAKCYTKLLTDLKNEKLRKT